MTSRRAILIAVLFAAVPAVAFCVLIFLRLFVFGVSRIPQNGMYPNLPAGTRVVTFLEAYDKPEDVRRGDVIVFGREVDGRRYKTIWRVVGLPGEVVQTNGGHVSVNGAAAQYWRSSRRNAVREQIGSVVYDVAIRPAENEIQDVSLKVPPRHFFVLGDNRSYAADSRELGCVAFESVAGKALWWW